jgi:hypothetical protein
LTASINLSPTIWTLFSLQWASRPLLNTSNENKILVSRCIMTTGAHIHVEGELREYDSKKTNSKQLVWEIRVSSILKLDRAEKAASEDQGHDDEAQEDTAA